MLRIATLTLLGLAGCAVTADRSNPALPPAGAPTADALQLLLVVTPHRDAPRGWLRRFQRDSHTAPWRSTSPTLPVEVGRNGLAWGRGLHPEPPAGALRKREGDGRAPAGVFRLESAFGSARASAARFIKLPYHTLAPGLTCVDDPSSFRYNTLVRRTEMAEPEWRSAENMDEERYRKVYRWGITVAHNRDPITPGAGSCIFMHIGDGRGDGTSGCTALSAKEMLATLIWVDRRRSPVLVQLTRDDYTARRAQWGLP